MITEHPSFTRVKTYPEPWCSHFPKSVEAAQIWKPFVRHVALTSRVLAVMTTRVEGMWCAYIDAVPGYDHEFEGAAVLVNGAKLDESIARVLFPPMKEIPYAG